MVSTTARGAMGGTDLFPGGRDVGFDLLWSDRCRNPAAHPLDKLIEARPPLGVVLEPLGKVHVYCPAHEIRDTLPFLRGQVLKSPELVVFKIDIRAVHARDLPTRFDPYSTS